MPKVSNQAPVKHQPDLSIAFATVSDLAGIVAVSQEAFPTDSWSWESLAKEFEHEFSHTLVVLSERLLGYLVFWHVLDEIHILQVATARTARRSGVGTALVRRCLSEGRSQGAETVLLEVRASNQAARRLYASLGFDELAIRRGYYSNPKEDGLVLVHHLGAL